MHHGLLGASNSGLPPYTLRVKITHGDETIMRRNGYATKVSEDVSGDIWDWTFETANWDSVFRPMEGSVSNILEVIGAGDTSGVTIMTGMFNSCKLLTSVCLFDTSNVTNINSMFYSCSNLTFVPLFNTSSATLAYAMFRNCKSLTSVPLFNTNSVTNMSLMFNGCTSLTSVPLFNTSNVTNISQMFNGCTNVESGALALYTQASTQATPPSNYTRTFRDCGSNTVTGAAELAQIPSDWK